MSKKILLSGYYGFDNVGDEAVLFSIVRDLRSVMGEEAEITVLSNTPEITASRYNVRAADRWNKKTLFSEIKNCDLFISGGGSLLQDVTSKNGVLYYLGLIALAEHYHKPVLIYAQGIGPLKSSRNRILTAKLLNKAAAITVRDKESADELQAMGVSKAITVTADPVLGLGRFGTDGALGREILSHYGWRDDKKSLAVALRPWSGSQSFVEETAKACARMQQSGWQLLFLPMQQEQDGEISIKAADKVRDITGEMPIVLEEQLTPAEMVSVFQNADMVLGMRLHALIIGAALKKPVVGLAYDPKVSAFMESIKNEAYDELAAVQSDDLLLHLSIAEGTEETGVNGDMIERAVYPAYLAQEILQRADDLAK